MILPLLRAATGPLHERVERTLDLASRLRTVESYAKYLERSYGFYKPMEERLAAWSGALGLDPGTRWKTPWLHSDLAWLGRSADDIARLPVCTPLSAPAGADEAFGCLYVLEGATLGGQVIRRQIERDLGLAAGRGGSFFTGYGDAVGPMWKEFCASLEAWGEAHPGCGPRIVQAAVETFTGFETWFRNEGEC
jgi:heme oxygenase (biliverdin-IX-beta and delta-forming)